MGSERETTTVFLPVDFCGAEEITVLLQEGGLLFTLLPERAVVVFSFGNASVEILCWRSGCSTPLPPETGTVAIFVLAICGVDWSADCHSSPFGPLTLEKER